MEKVFENYVTHSFSRYQEHYRVSAQHPQKHLAMIDGKEAFTTKPDIVLREGERIRFILDAKWKDIEGFGDDLKHGIDQADMYQLYAYGKLYRCDAVALVYPRTVRFTRVLRYRLIDGLHLICLPFDVTKPGESGSIESAGVGGEHGLLSVFCGRPESKGKVVLRTVKAARRPLSEGGEIRMALKRPGRCWRPLCLAVIYPSTGPSLTILVKWRRLTLHTHVRHYMILCINH